MDRLLAQSDCIRRAPDQRTVRLIDHRKQMECRVNSHVYARCGADPMLFLMTLRRLTPPETMAFVDVTVSQYWATEVFHAYGPRTFFNPVDNQSMGWSIPAAIGAQKVNPGRLTVTITGDGCFLMSATEISTAARECLPVKFFIFDDQAYHYMQLLQQSAYLRTTATILARINYRALAEGYGVAYQEIVCNNDLEPVIHGALAHPGPVLTRVLTDYRARPVRWIEAARDRYVQDLSPQQKAFFLTRLGSRAVDFHREND
jgi:acetolactate synthase-1/2/3 large subunit